MIYVVAEKEVKERLERLGRVRVETEEGGVISRGGGFGDFSKRDNFCFKTVY